MLLRTTTYEDQSNEPQRRVGERSEQPEEKEPGRCEPPKSRGRNRQGCQAQETHEANQTRDVGIEDGQLLRLEMLDPSRDDPRPIELSEKQDGGADLDGGTLSSAGPMQA